MMLPPILEIKDIHKHFGAVRASDDVNLTVKAGDIHALIGPNGAGKSTLLNIISGELAPDSGSVRFKGIDVTRTSVHKRAENGLMRTYQVTGIIPSFTVLETVTCSLNAEHRGFFGFFQTKREKNKIMEKADTILNLLGLSSKMDAKSAALSHGDKRKLALACVLVREPDLLLLDEPTAGLGMYETREITDLLNNLRPKKPMLLVEHDMNVVFSLADTVSVLVYGKIAASGAPDDIRAHPEVIRAYLGEDNHA